MKKKTLPAINRKHHLKKTLPCTNVTTSFEGTEMEGFTKSQMTVY
jgi:hypothetical protein